MADDTVPLFADSGKFYVYVYRDPRPKKKNVPIYVGKGTAANGRADVHWRKGARNPLFGAVMAKIRAANLEPIVEIVAWFEDEPDAFRHEQKLIEAIGIRSAGGTLCNLLIGAGGGWTHSEETKAKIREKRSKQRIAHSPETAAKISAAQKGVKRGPNPEHSARLKGRKLPLSHREKIASSHIGHPVSQETREKISRAHRGRKRPDEARENMRIARLGKEATQEVREKMSAAQKRRWEAWRLKNSCPQ